MNESKQVVANIFETVDGSLAINLQRGVLNKEVRVFHSDGSKTTLYVDEFNCSFIENPLTGKKELIVHASLVENLEEGGQIEAN